MRNLSENEKQMLSKLVIGKTYWIRNKQQSSGNTEVPFSKFKYIGMPNGNDNLLMFEKVQAKASQKTYKESFLVLDYLLNHLCIYDKEDYKKYKTEKLWESIEKLVK